MVTKKEKTTQLDIRESVHKVWLASLGALSVAEEEGGRFFTSLVDKGGEIEARGKARIDKATDTVTGKVKDAKEMAGDTFDRLGKNLDEQVAETLGRLGVPTRDEIQKLTQRVEELNGKMDRLKATPKAAPRKKATTATKRVN